MFCLGSPLAVFLALRGIRPQGTGSPDHFLPSGVCRRLFNIYHPADPVVRLGSLQAQTSVTWLFTGTNICHMALHRHKHLSLGSSQAQTSVTNICHMALHRHKHLSQTSVTWLFTGTNICHLALYRHKHLSQTSVTWLFTGTNICHKHLSHGSSQAQTCVRNMCQKHLSLCSSQAQTCVRNVSEASVILSSQAQTCHPTASVVRLGSPYVQTSI